MDVTLEYKGKSRLVIKTSTYADTINPDSASARRKAAVAIGVPDAWLLGRVQEYGASKDAKTYVYTEEASQPTLITVTRRGILGNERTTHTGEVVDTFRGLLVPSNDADLVLEWDDAESACILDVDYHGCRAPDAGRLLFLVSRLEPAPVCYWTSRSGGLHAVYFNRDSIPANVLAAVGGVCWSSLDSTCTFDIIPRTRVPVSTVSWGTADVSLDALRKFLSGGVTEQAVDEYLEQRGLLRGRAYEHTHCPASQATSHGMPVYIGDAGIICKRCEAAGVVLGSRKPGFFPYTSLCGSVLSSDVYRMVKNLTHWSQAEIVLDARLGLHGAVARAAYMGLLTLYHGVRDVRIPRVFSAGDNLIRGNGRWVTKERYETLIGIRQTLGRLPFSRTDEDKLIVENQDILDQGVNLSSYGYAPIQPVFGCRIFGHFLGSDYGPVTKVLPPRDLMNPGQESLWPKYIDAQSRMSQDDAFAIVHEAFPGIDRNLVYLLIAARGVAEGEVGIPPNVLIAGPSRTGKSTAVILAAAICGDTATEVQWSPNAERFRQGYLEGANKGSFVVVNELLKTAKTGRVSARAAFDVFLTLTPGSVSHVLYTGPVPLGRLPATVVTDTGVPAEVREDIQLSRRFVYVDTRKLGVVNWERSLVESGVRQVDRFRSSSQTRAEASNAIVSHVIDTFFSQEALTLAEIGTRLGFTTLEHCDDMEMSQSLPMLFDSVCSAPAIPDTHQHFKRWPGCGWKLLGYEDTSDLAESWRAVCDGVESMDAFASSRKASEVDWATVIPGVPVGTMLDVSRHGRLVALRFRCGSARGCAARYNEELLS